MAKVIITQNLRSEIEKKFKAESVTVFSLIYTLVDNPKKGDVLGCVGNIVLKKIKYKKFRFYFIADQFKIKFLKSTELQDLLIKFVRMSDKKNQQQTINEIKKILRLVGEEGF